MTSLRDLEDRVGEEVAVSPWIEITQERIDTFARAVEDFQWIHVDRSRAQSSPFGGTIAHGFLTLSLLSLVGSEVMPPIEGRAMGINYGFDKIRFISPVRAGGKIRGRFKLKEVTERAAKEVMFRYEVAIEIEGTEKPAIVAEWLTMAVLA